MRRRAFCAPGCIMQGMDPIFLLVLVLVVLLVVFVARRV